MSQNIVNPYRFVTEPSCNAEHTSAEGTLGIGSSIVRGALLTLGDWSCIGANAESFIVKLSYRTTGGGGPLSAGNVIYCRIYNSANVLQTTLGSITGDNITSTPTEYTFDSPDSTHAMQGNDHISIDMATTGNDNRLNIDVTDSAVDNLKYEWYTTSWFNTTGSLYYKFNTD